MSYHRFLFRFLTGQTYIHYLSVKSPKIETTPEKVPSPSAPISYTASDVTSAGRRQKTAATRRKGIESTIYAGGNPSLGLGAQLLSGNKA